MASPSSLPIPEVHISWSHVELIQRASSRLREELGSTLSASLPTVHTNYRAECDAIAEEFQIGVTEVTHLVRVILLLFSGTPATEDCARDIRCPSSAEISFLLFSLEEMRRCIHNFARYTADCSVYPTLSSTPAFSLNRKFSFCVNLVQVAFYRFIFKLRSPNFSENPRIGCDLSKDVAIEILSCAPLDLFEWCAREFRPVLKQSILELGKQILQQPYTGMEADWFQLREARSDRERSSQFAETMREPSAEPSDPQALVNIVDIQIGKSLGEGSYGSVYKCKWHDQDVAVKIILNSNETPELEQRFHTEGLIQSSFRHPNIVRTFGYKIDEQGVGAGYILMEEMESSLDKIIRARISDSRTDAGESPVFSVDVSMDMMRQIVEGMCALRAERVMHRDLKPGNILVSRVTESVGPSERVYQVKLADFGNAKQRDVGNSIYNTLTVGTVAYMAPEVIRDLEAWNQGGYSWKADVYSFAMVCSEILTRKRPFEHLNRVTSQNVRTAVLNGERPQLPLEREDPLRGLIEDCWKFDPHERPDVFEVRRRLSECRLRRFFVTERLPVSFFTALGWMPDTPFYDMDYERDSDLMAPNFGVVRLSTTIVNKTTLTIALKECRGGVYGAPLTLRGLPDVQAKPSNLNRIILKLDPKSMSYKNYTVSARFKLGEHVTAPIGIFIPSDFIMDNSIVYIVPNPSPNARNPLVFGGDRRLNPIRVANFGDVLRLSGPNLYNDNIGRGCALLASTSMQVAVQLLSFLNRR